MKKELICSVCKASILSKSGLVVHLGGYRVPIYRFYHEKCTPETLVDEGVNISDIKLHIILNRILQIVIPIFLIAAVFGFSSVWFVIAILAVPFSALEVYLFFAVRKLEIADSLPEKKRF